ncbi:MULTISPECIES: flagellar biosynthesis protein FlhB [unclassified Janthinobacterium]|uniref:Flagellar biosynthetic protein FlhB n=1 Tax=Janthinobacterium lividum TaxID=29581 RepID=A0A1E8PTQ9_9BURK|nr:flagellar biosynthesis protein FlhB [Janthinobacterium sp. CG_23.4]MDH6159183.1 flagellar biosynthetic protein FlhB [Janthinobacterium sp. CG_23.4]OFJ49732.1 flagellar biosynthesis protein FlhB [Janthinobacterium lividum]
MSDDSDAEKTEAASPKRLEQAREEGDVPRSREVATFTVLMASGCCLWFAGDAIVRRLTAVMVSGLTLEREQILNPDAMMLRIGYDVGSVLLTCLPYALAIMLVALASPVLVGGWLFSSKAFAPNFGKLNPIRGLGNMFSKNALVELLKAVAKTIVVGVVAWMVMQHQKDAVLGLSVESLRSGSAHLISLLITAFLLIVGALGLIAAIDGPYQMWHYANKMKMSLQEVKQEAKESDGNPQIKAKIRQMQHEMSRRRMMADVPTADVVVTNPTHYAVALKYGENSRGAPQVVAKGIDEVAAKIRELAGEHKVAILEAPALARALYQHTDIGDEIPEALYGAVAEVLAYVFQLRSYGSGHGQRPDKPKKLDVPPELDPLDPASQAKTAADKNKGSTP